MYQQEEEGLRRKLDKHVAENAEKWDIDNTVRALLCFGFPSTCPPRHNLPHSAPPIIPPHLPPRHAFEFAFEVEFGSGVRVGY